METRARTHLCLHGGASRVTGVLIWLGGGLHEIGRREMADQIPEQASGDEPFPQGRRCYVGNLAWRTSWQDLKDHFKPCGNVVYANVMQDGQGTSLARQLRVLSPRTIN